jgi:RimJ/RimL family protein N-acetyltransferase
MKPSHHNLSSLTARRMAQSDTKALLRWYIHPTVTSGVDDETLSKAVLTRKLDMLAACDPFEDGQCGILIEHKGKPVSFFHFMWINWIGRTAELDMMIDPYERDLRILSRSVLLKLGEVAFEEFNLNKLYGFIYESNERSLRFFGRFSETEAQLKGYLKRTGKVEDVFIVGITRAQYLGYRANVVRDAYMLDAQKEPSRALDVTRDFIIGS